MVLALFAPLYWPLGLPAAGWALTCLSYGLVLGAREHDLCAAASGYAAIVMQLAWSVGHWREIVWINTHRRP